MLLSRLPDVALSIIFDVDGLYSYYRSTGTGMTGSIFPGFPAERLFMLFILLNWIFIFITCLGTGYFLFQLIQKLLHARGERVSLSLIIIAGLFVITVACGFITFISPLNAFWRYAIFLVSCLTIVIYRIPVRELITEAMLRWKQLNPVSKSILIAIFLIAWIKSAGPSELIDEGGYFLPYIRWIEDFPLVPGIANIEDRMGFNSSFHLLCAFFSMREWIPEGLYDLNGFLLVVCCSYFITGPDNLLKRDAVFLLSDYVKSFCLFFLLRNMLTASPSDLANVFFAELACILFIEKVEKQRLQETDGAFIMLYLVTILLVTIKFSSVAMMLLPVSLLFFNKQHFRKNVIFFFTLSVVVFAAWMIRSYYLSGYIIYPLYIADLFDPVWKVPESIARNQYYYVQQFARLNIERADSESTAVAMTLTEWVPVWFKMQNGFNKITGITLAITLIVSIYYLVFRKMLSRGYLVLYFVLLVNLALWFINFPAFRFGWAFIIVFIALIVTFVVYQSGFLKQYRYVVLLVTGLFTLQSLYKTWKENRSYMVSNSVYPVVEPYPKMTSLHLGTVQVEVSAKEECWGVQPPCLPVNYNRNLKAIGNRPEDGFFISKN